MTHRIVRKNVGRIAKMLVMDSRVLARKFISIELCFATATGRPNNYSETSSSFWTFSDVKAHFSLYFISRVHHMSIILTSLPLSSGFIFVSTAKGFFLSDNFVGVNFFMQRNNNRHIFKLKRRECRWGFLHAAPFILFKIYPRVWVCIFQ